MLVQLPFANSDIIDSVLAKLTVLLFISLAFSCLPARSLPCGRLHVTGAGEIEVPVYAVAMDIGSI